MNRDLVVISVAIAVVCLCQAQATGAILHHFETLHYSSIRHHISKRDLYSEHPDERQLEYTSFGRNFHLILHKISGPVFSEDLKVVAVDAHNNERIVNYKPVIYHGYLADEPQTSSVKAYWEDDSTLMAAINTNTELYVVEPAWRHISNSSSNTMITYRGSDVEMEKHLGDHFCGYVRPPGWSENDTLSPADANKNSRTKRQTSCSGSNRTCTLLLVADYRFYENMGLGSIAKTTSYLFMQIDKINEIYKQQEFGVCKSGFNFEIKEIRIHESASSTPAYNEEKPDNTKWGTTDLLESFSADIHNSRFCLSHLFTAYAFESGTLGLSYVASSSQNYPGGICSIPYQDTRGSRTRTLYLNTGWSSSLNRYSKRLLTLEASLVTAHEFGHNWGSEHDPDSPECSPSASSGGKYIMYTYSVSGLDANNKIFSPCSRRSIGAVLLSKANNCFKQPSGSFCGNSLVEKDEQCDVGSAKSDACCDSTCHLVPGAKCSDANEVCCEKCQYAPRSKVCAIALDDMCVTNATCSGNSTKCLPQNFKPNGTSCSNYGRCSDNGECSSLCGYDKKDSCVCDTVENSCKWCCRERDDVNKTCQPHYRNYNLPNGMPCLQGFCKEGVCLRQVHDSIKRIWDIIENVTVDKLVMFMRANIVGTVIILSLVLWIPASCVVSCIDRQRDREEKERVQWFDRTNDNLIRSEEQRRLTIRRVDAPKLRLYIPPPQNH